MTFEEKLQSEMEEQDVFDSADWKKVEKAAHWAREETLREVLDILRFKIDVGFNEDCVESERAADFLEKHFLRERSELGVKDE